MRHERAFNKTVKWAITSGLPLLALAMIMALGGCKKSIKAAPPAGVKVTVARVQSSNVTETATLIGRLDSRHTVTLHPQVEGTITQILVQPGDMVRKGQLLLAIDSRKQQAVVAEKESDVATAKADYQKEVAKLASYQAESCAQQASAFYDKNEFERNCWLEKRGVVSESSVDGYHKTYQVSLAKLQEIDANICAQKDVISRAARAVDAAAFSLKAQQEQLAFYQITAPFAGVMADIPVKVGDYVSTPTRLTAVSELKPLEAKVLVPADMAPGLRLGMILEILSSNDKVIASCPVFHIDPIVDQQNQSVLIKAIFDNRSEKFRPDQAVSTQLILKQHPGISIPSTALSFVAGRAFAYVVSSAQGKGPIAQQRPVKISSMQGNRAVLSAGIKEGEEIVVSGIQNVREHSPLIIE